jgi:DNA-binding transcriptional MocR family regulator
LPPHINALQLYHRALEAKISITPGPIYSAKQQYQNFIRLNYGSPWTPAIEDAMKKLGQIMATMKPAPKDIVFSKAE